MLDGPMGHDFTGRLARAGEAASRAAVDSLLVTPSSDLLYLCGYGPPQTERLTVLVVRPGADPLLVLPELEEPRAAATPAGSLLELRPWKDGQDPYEAVREVARGARSVAVSDSMPSVHLLRLQGELERASFVPASSLMAPLRIHKDRAEIDALAEAGRADDEAFRRITGERLEGRTEVDVARALRGHIVDAGQDEALFWIVGSGSNGASPHHEPARRRIGRGEPVVLDFGGSVGGYRSDMTRTVAVGEPQDPEVRDVHAIVHEAQETAFRAARPGVPAEEIDRTARDIIGSAGYGPSFIHRTGHGIGLDVHEEPYLVRGNATALEPGMCFSIEPGIYLAGRFGVRIEDIVVVTEDGARRLNQAPRELAIID
jgi:Xaa-Pro aminopeptidase